MIVTFQGLHLEVVSYGKASHNEAKLLHSYLLYMTPDVLSRQSYVILIRFIVDEIELTSEERWTW